MLRAPFSLEKIHWNEKTKQVIFRSKRSWHTKQNYQIFTAADFIAASVEHIPPKGQQTIRYYGRYSNKRRGWDAKNRIQSPQSNNTKNFSRGSDSQSPDRILFILPEPAPKKKHAEKPDWKSLIKRIWGGDPTICPCCRGQMKNVGTIIRRAEIEFFLKLWGMWEGIISLPPPPNPPSISKPWNLRNCRLAGRSRPNTFNLPKNGGIRTTLRNGAIPNYHWKTGTCWCSTPSHYLPKSFLCFRLADCQLVQKTQSLIKEVAGRSCLNSRKNRRKAMQSSGILDFSPQKPNSLIEMKSKSEFSPFLPLHPLKPGRTDAPVKNP